MHADAHPLLQAFKLFDTNNDGAIEYEEFMKALKRLNIDLSNMQVRQ